MRIFQEKIFDRVVAVTSFGDYDDTVGITPHSRAVQQSGIVRETHKMMLDHYQQTKTC
jgi:hypothetical protein